jgi:hypothetical protein
MPIYRLIFPAPAGEPAEHAKTVVIDSGDETYAVNAELEYDGKQWRVDEVPLEHQDDDGPIDILVWPAE